MLLSDVCLSDVCLSVSLSVAYIRVVHGLVDPRVGLGWVGNGSKICVFSGLGWVMGLK